jgi:hypothetical protein
MHVEDGHVYWQYPEWIRDPVPEYSVAAVHDTVRAHVPAGSSVLVVADEGDELMEMEGYETSPFPGSEGPGWEEIDETGAIEALEALRERGARFIVFPQWTLQRLAWGLPSMQERLESRYQGLLRDGSICALYALE